MEYEQNMNLGSITLARSPLDTLRDSRKNGLRTKSEFGIHYFGMELFGYIERIQKKKRNGTWTKSEFKIHYFGMELLRYIEAIQKKNEMEYEQNLNLESITLA